VTRIGEVAELADEGVNAAGIRHILSLSAELEMLHAKIAAVRERCTALESRQAGAGPAPNTPLARDSASPGTAT
jgi:hypothetical protein